jgi:hypothetical protein
MGPGVDDVSPVLFGYHEDEFVHLLYAPHICVATIRGFVGFRWKDGRQVDIFGYSAALSDQLAEFLTPSSCRRVWRILAPGVVHSYRYEHSIGTGENALGSLQVLRGSSAPLRQIYYRTSSDLGVA